MSLWNCVQCVVIDRLACTREGSLSTVLMALQMTNRARAECPIRMRANGWIGVALRGMGQSRWTLSYGSDAIGAGVDRQLADLARCLNKLEGVLLILSFVCSVAHSLSHS